VRISSSAQTGVSARNENMQRDLEALADRRFDIVVVGGGIFGLCAAYDAALRGFSVALVERGDLSAATSAACFKMVHGGVRYLQHADVVRLRQSAAERRVLLRIAPHLVQPLPIVIPTYGHGAKGKALLGAGLRVYEALTLDRNRGVRDPGRRIERAWFMSRGELLKAFPGVRSEGLTGAAVFEDGQMYSASRLGLAFAHSAAAAGAQIANYCEVTGFVREHGRVAGVTVRDSVGGAELDVLGQVIINAAGPWAEQLLAAELNIRLQRPSTFSRDTFLMTTRAAPGRFALAATGRTRDPDAVLSRDARHLFVVPWHQRLIVGVWHGVHRGDADSFVVTDEEIAAYLDEINWAYPGLELQRSEISMWSAGLVLFGENRPGTVDLSYGKRSRLIDHAEHGVPNLLTLIGVRYTTARAEAAHAVDWAARRLDAARRPCLSATRALAGGDIADTSEFLAEAQREYGRLLPEPTLAALARNHGRGFRVIAEAAKRDAGAAERLGGSDVIAAEVEHAVSEEMALRLADVVLRRTNLGDIGHPGREVLDATARCMGDALGWDADRRRREIESVEGLFAWRGSAPDATTQTPAAS
jgi:glycerol-3-phosphate dehydrogenase